jgi:aryl-alcohol dehydrogenase-like predicted oxidoreductase
MSLKTIPLGASGPQVPAIGIGLMSLGHAYGNAGTTSERLAFLDALYARGETFWDDADIYGDSEDVVGEWFTLNPEKRKDIFLATKFGIVFDPADMSKTTTRSDPEYIDMALERSLGKLKTDYIDLYYRHRVDTVTPIEITMRKLAEKVKEGKIKYIGLSEVTLGDLKRAHAVHPITALQTEYSPW